MTSPSLLNVIAQTSPLDVFCIWCTYPTSFVGSILYTTYTRTVRILLITIDDSLPLEYFTFCHVVAIICNNNFIERVRPFSSTVNIPRIYRLCHTIWRHLITIIHTTNVARHSCYTSRHILQAYPFETLQFIFAINIHSTGSCKSRTITSIVTYVEI